MHATFKFAEHGKKNLSDDSPPHYSMCYMYIIKIYESIYLTEKGMYANFTQRQVTRAGVKPASVPQPVAYF